MAGLSSAVNGLVFSKFQPWNQLCEVFARNQRPGVPEEVYHSSKKLNLGCSSQPLPTYINVDVQEKFNPDMVCNADTLRFAKDNEFDLVRASHILEHFALKDCKAVLQEWRRVLKPGGYLVVCVPFYEALAWRTVLWPAGLALDERTLRNGWINGLFALDLPPEFRHKIIFTESSLTRLLHECGFQVKARLNYFNEEPYTLGIKDDSCNSFSLNLTAVKRS